MNRLRITHIILIIIGIGISNDFLAQTPDLIVEMQPVSGKYDSDMLVSLYAPKGAIYYTLNGNEPTRRSIRYRGPFKIRKTTVVRAAAYRYGQKSQVLSQTYLIKEPTSSIPIVSLSVPPHQLFNPEYGLFTEGENITSTHPAKYGANYWSRRKLTVNVEIFEINEDKVFNGKTEFRVFGGVSRTFPQKSFSVSLDKNYGVSEFKYPLFGESGPKKIKHLVFRNSGSDWGKSHFRDAYVTSLTRNLDFETQRYRPVHIYINGKYWGMYNMREKVNRYFLDTYYDIDRDSIDLLEGRYLIKSGYRTEYLKLIRYLRNNDLSSEEHYAYIKSKIDVESFTDFIITQIFVNNRDAGGNVKYWRVQDETSKWRWILYDTDFGFGLHNPKGYRENALEFFTEANGPKYPNPPWSTIWLRSLLKNEDFRNHFINRFQDHLNTTFRTDRMLKHLYAMVDLYDPEISRHLKKWNLSKKRRDLHLAIMERFALRRPDYMYNDLSEYFDLGDLLKVVIAPHDNGDLVLNQHLDIVEPFEGRYFQKTKIRLQAYPYYGFRFSHWEGLPEHITQHNIVVSLEKYDSLSIRPVFEPYTHSITGRVIFNEINAYSQDIGDWVEIFNTSNEIVDIGNWIITDLRNEYHLPNMFINPGEYVVVCQDTTLFRKKFGSTDFNIVGNLPFGINKRKEYIALYDADGASVDSLSYDIEPIDSSFTLNLLLPHLDNSDIENWEIRPGLGTPNAENPYVLESRIREKQMMWMRSGSVIGFVFILLFMLLFHKRLEKL